MNEARHRLRSVLARVPGGLRFARLAALAVALLSVETARADHHAEPAPAAAGTDHQAVVRRWGVDARQMATLAASGNSIDPRCPAGSACPVQVNALSVRRWVHECYAWNAGLALAVGGGATDGSPTVGTGGTWDTHFGVGPVAGANFLLGQTRHMAVSLLPQASFLAFLPSGSGSKTFLVDVRGVIEAELHLGMLGLPQVSLGTSAGLAASWVKKTRPDAGYDVAGGIPGQVTFAAWNVGVVGPQSLWGLVNQSFVRVYF